MSPVNCYFLNVPVDFKIVPCRLLNLRKYRVALSLLSVKGPFMMWGYLTHIISLH